MRSIHALTAVAMVIAGGVVFVPSPQHASAEIKQLAIAVINYHGDSTEPDPFSLKHLIPQSRDEVLGLLMAENDVVVEAVVIPGRDRDFVDIRLSSGKVIPAFVVSSDDGEMLVMDADGELALFVLF